MKKIPKRLFSVLLALAMLVSLVPEQVFAADASNALPTTPSVTRLESAQTVGVEFVPEDEADVSDTDAQQETGALFSDSGGDNANEDGQLSNEQNTTQDSTLVDVPVSAELMADGYTSGDYTYTVSNGTATITGYSGSGDNVSIPSTIGGYSVSSIGDYAFSGCTALTNISIPSGVTSIGYRAFQYCSVLAEVAVPSSVTSIGYQAFRDCSSLKKITVPSSVTEEAVITEKFHFGRLVPAKVAQSAISEENRGFRVGWENALLLIFAKLLKIATFNG